MSSKEESGKKVETKTSEDDLKKAREELTKETMKRVRTQLVENCLYENKGGFHPSPWMKEREAELVRHIVEKYKFSPDVGNLGGKKKKSTSGEYSKLVQFTIPLVCEFTMGELISGKTEKGRLFSIVNHCPVFELRNYLGEKSSSEINKLIESGWDVTNAVLLSRTVKVKSCNNTMPLCYYSHHEYIQFADSSKVAIMQTVPQFSFNKDTLPPPVTFGRKDNVMAAVGLFDKTKQFLRGILKLTSFPKIVYADGTKDCWAVVPCGHALSYLLVGPKATIYNLHPVHINGKVEYLLAPYAMLSRMAEIWAAKGNHSGYNFMDYNFTVGPQVEKIAESSEAAVEMMKEKMMAMKIKHKLEKSFKFTISFELQFEILVYKKGKNAKENAFADKFCVPWVHDYAHANMSYFPFYDREGVREKIHEKFSKFLQWQEKKKANQKRSLKFMSDLRKRKNEKDRLHDALAEMKRILLCYDNNITPDGEKMTKNTHKKLSKKMALLREKVKDTEKKLKQEGHSKDKVDEGLSDLIIPTLNLKQTVADPEAIL